jgi:hypothetical protein
MEKFQLWRSSRLKRRERSREAGLAINANNDVPVESIGLFPLEPLGVDMGAAPPLLESVIPYPSSH